MNEKELSDKTDKKPTNPMARSTSFKKGNRANPNGRPKGSVNEVTKFKRAVALFEKEELNHKFDIIPAIIKILITNYDIRKKLHREAVELINQANAIISRLTDKTGK